MDAKQFQACFHEIQLTHTVHLEIETLSINLLKLNN